MWRNVFLGCDQYHERPRCEFPLRWVIHWQRLQSRVQRLRPLKPWVKTFLTARYSGDGWNVVMKYWHSQPAIAEQDMGSNCVVCHDNWVTVKWSCLVKETNHQRACLLGPFYLPLSLRSAPLSILSGLYVVSRYERNGFIIALISRDKHWQHDGCRKHKLSQSPAQFVILVYLPFLFLRSLPSFFVVFVQLAPIILPAILASASEKSWSVMAGMTVATWAMRWIAVSSTWPKHFSVFPPLLLGLSPLLLLWE